MNNKLIVYKTSMIILLILILISCTKEEITSSIADNTVMDTSAVSAASSVILAMGTGFNLGNTFDFSQNPTSPESIMPIIDLYYNAGMRHIRIPITWKEGFNGNTLADVSGFVNYQHPRFLQLKSVIDYALERNMYVVINTHHEHWLKDNYDGSAAHDSVFTNLWRGIAVYFKNYSNHLIFEILNEPDGVFGDWNGGPTPTDPIALALTRNIYFVGYKAIRESGGKNATRIIMVSTNGMGNQSQIEEVYPNKASLPGGGLDPYLAIQVHTYDPWSFCGENGSNAAWPGGNSLISAVQKVGVHSKFLGVPVNYGELGVGRAANVAERNTDVVRDYYRIMRLAVLDQKMSITYWDDRGWFGLITPDGSGSYKFLYNIVPSLMTP